MFFGYLAYTDNICCMDKKISGKMFASFKLKLYLCTQKIGDVRQPLGLTRTIFMSARC